MARVNAGLHTGRDIVPTKAQTIYDVIAAADHALTHPEIFLAVKEVLPALQERGLRNDVSMLVRMRILDTEDIIGASPIRREPRVRYRLAPGASRPLSRRATYSGNRLAMIERAAERYLKGATLEEIGQEFGVTREAIRQLLEKHKGMAAFRQRTLAQLADRVGRLEAAVFGNGKP